MRKIEIMVGLLLIAGHFMTEIHSFARYLIDHIEKINLDLFWSASFHFKLNIEWYFKMLFDDLFVVLCFYIMTKMAALISERLFLICAVYLFYHIVDSVSFIYDYKQSYNVYLGLLFCSSLAVYFLIRPDNYKMKIVR